MAKPANHNPAPANHTMAYLIGAIVFLIFVIGIYGYIILDINYNQSQSLLKESNKQLKLLNQSNKLLNESNQMLQSKVDSLDSSYQALSSNYADLYTNYTQTKTENTYYGEALTICQTNALTNELNNQQIIQQLQENNSNLEQHVLFKGGQATLTYRLNDDSKHTTTYDVQTLNYYVSEGTLNRDIIDSYKKGNSEAALTATYGQERLNRFMVEGQFSPLLTLTSSNGVRFTVPNYLAFGDTSSVSSFATYLRDHSQDDLDFIKNVLYVKEQLNTYTKNIVGQPRYPLETFLEGGGDCGASSIFVGSVIKAAHPDWQVKLWYVNSNSISNPGSSINHAIISVNNWNGINMFIETTEDNPEAAMDVYDNKQVEGWSYELS